LKLPLKSIILAAFAAAIIVVAFFVWASFRNVQQGIAESIKIKDCSQVQQLVDILHANLEAEEIAADNFTYNPNDSTLTAYNIAASRLLADTQQLNKIKRYDSSNTDDINIINSHINKKAAYFKKADSLYHTGNNRVNMKQLATEMFQNTSLDKVRNILAEIETSNREAIMQSGAEQQQIAQNTLKQFYLLALALLIMLSFLYLVIIKGLQIRQKAADDAAYQASLISSIPDAIISTDAQLTITGWNKYAEEMYGYSFEEVKGKIIGQFLKIQLSSLEYKHSFEELNRTGFYKDEYTAIDKNGNEIAILASVTVIKNSTGIVTGYVAVHRDISVRKQAEKRLQAHTAGLEHEVYEKSTQISSILQRITDGFLALDSNFTFTFVNKQAGEILGYKPEAMIGKNIFTDFKAIASLNFNEACRKAYETQQHCFLENYYAPLDTWIENDIYPSPDGLTVFFKDITYKKKAEVALKQSEEQLHKSYEQIRHLAAHLQHIREEERTNMAREIHDELGQQLTGLNMYISWLSKKVQTNDPEIKEKFASTAALLDDTVKMVRKISSSLRPSMLDDLGLIAAIEWQSNEFEKRSGIKTEFINLAGNLNIPGNIATGLFRIFQESLTNVARHAGATTVNAVLRFRNNHIIFTITDNGQGFILNEIGSEKTLGLFGMKERTMMMGGQYEIVTGPGKGTTVSVQIPVGTSA
jgi:PAS domain S-box-containing protein